MAKILKYVLGLDGANRFDSFYSVGAPAQDLSVILRWIIAIITSLMKNLTLSFSVAVGIVTLAPRRRVACSAM